VKICVAVLWQQRVGLYWWRLLKALHPTQATPAHQLCGSCQSDMYQCCDSYVYLCEECGFD
jgi:hypothetical protein